MSLRRCGIAAAWLAVLTLSAAETQSYDKPDGYVSDFARVFDASSATAIAEYAGSLQRATGVQAAVVTVPSLNGEPIEDFANNLYRKWGIGQKGSNEGLLILLAVQDRKVRVEVGYGLEPILTDGYVGGVQRSVRGELRGGKYGEAARKLLEAFGTKIGQARGTLQSKPGTGFLGDLPEQQNFPLWVFMSVAFFVTVGFLIPIFREVRGIMRANRATGGARRAAAAGAGAAAWSGGGFGGSDWGSSSSSSYDSSSSSSSSSDFGGFGGGDSGGGGASSDW